MNAKQKFYQQPDKKIYMKNFSIFLFILTSACHAPTANSASRMNTTEKNSNSNTIQKISFSTGSRGYQKKLSFTKDSVILIINSSFEDKPSKNSRTAITNAEWTKLNNSLNGVDIAKLEELESPTMKRAVDAANHSTIMIFTDKEHNHAFDDYNPNEQLKKLLDVIQEIEKDRSK